MEAGTSGGPEATGYNGAAVAGAVLATFFFPLIALIAALLLLGAQKDPSKRASLRMWAWVSGGWILLQVVLALVLASVTLTSGSSGGPVIISHTGTTLSP